MTSSSSNSPNKTVDSVLKLNIKGTKLLQTRRYGKAIAAFSSCLTKVKDLVASMPRDGDKEAEMLGQCFLSFRFLQSSSSSGPSQMSLSDNSDLTMNSSSLDQHPTDTATANDDTDVSDTATSFQSPILVVRDDAPHRRRQRATPSTSPHKSMVLLSIAILYNLAITFHLSALDEKKDDPASQQRRLQKALALYQTAKNMIQEHQHDHLVGVMEIMALLNNMGQVHWLLGQRVEAQVCFEEMLGDVLWITHCGDRRAVFQFELFFHNAMTHMQHPSKSAAAA